MLIGNPYSCSRIHPRRAYTHSTKRHPQCRTYAALSRISSAPCASRQALPRSLTRQGASLHHWTRALSSPHRITCVRSLVSAKESEDLLFIHSTTGIAWVGPSGTAHPGEQSRVLVLCTFLPLSSGHHQHVLIHQKPPTRDMRPPGSHFWSQPIAMRALAVPSDAP